MEGIPLLLSMICINATYCPNEMAAPSENYNVMRSQTVYVNKAMEKLVEEIKGQTLRVATLEDYPLSYVDTVGKMEIGRGQAFEFLDILMKKYNFNYTIVKPKFNIIGGSNSSDGSLIELLMHKVSKYFY